MICADCRFVLCGAVVAVLIKMVLEHHPWRQSDCACFATAMIRYVPSVSNNSLNRASFASRSATYFASGAWSVNTDSRGLKVRKDQGIDVFFTLLLCRVQHVVCLGSPQSQSEEDT